MTVHRLEAKERRGVNNCGGSYPSPRRVYKKSVPATALTLRGQPCNWASIQYFLVLLLGALNIEHKAVKST